MDFPIDFVMGQKRRLGQDYNGGGGGAAVTQSKVWKAQSGIGQATHCIAPDVWNGGDNRLVHVL